MWLQFHQFAEIVAEMFFAQAFKAEDSTNAEPYQRAASDMSLASNASTTSSNQRSPMFTESPGSTHSLMSSSSLSSLTGHIQSAKLESVDELKIKTLRIQFGLKSWHGQKRLGKEIANLARLRSMIELFLSDNRVAESAEANLPAFSLLTTFTVRGIRVLACAEPLGDKFNIVPVDKRDVAELSGALKASKMLRCFPYQDFPQLWVHQIPGRKDTTLVRVTSRYDDVLCNSMRSKLVHGMLIRSPANRSGGRPMIEALTAADLKELTTDKPSQSIPYLNMSYYQLDAPVQSVVQNYAAKGFLLKSSNPAAIPLVGDIVIAADDDTSKVQLNLLEGFVLKRQIEIHPLVRRLQELKKNKAVLSLMMTGSSRSGRSRQDPGIAVSHEFENTLKIILVQHIKDFTSQLVTIGDVLAPSSATNKSFLRSQTLPHQMHQRLARSNTMLSAPRSLEYSSMNSYSGASRDAVKRPAIRRRRSSLAATTLPEEEVDNKGFYIIDALHLRRVMREEGVNVCFLPLVFHHLDEHRQHGMKIIVAAEIVSRLAKTLFRYRMFSDEVKLQSRWKSRKTRTVKFIDSIIHGLFHSDLPGATCPIRECIGDQFWHVDAPIWYALGSFAGSFSLDPHLFEETRSLDKLRQLLKANPSLLFTCLLKKLGARLSESVLPDIHENRFLSVPFMRSASDVEFDDEESAVQDVSGIDHNYLWSYLQFFRIQFEQVNTSSMSREDGGSWLHYYRRRAREFRSQMLLDEGSTLENAMNFWEDKMTVRAHLSEALRNVSTSPSPTPEQRASAYDSCQQARNILSTSTSLFPIEYKVALQCLELMCTGDDFPTEIAKCESLLATLRFFYRPANLAQFVRNGSSHPVYSLQFATSLDDLHHTFSTPAAAAKSNGSMSLRMRLQSEQDRSVWVGVMAAVDSYCRRVEAKNRDPVIAASLKAVFSGRRRAEANDNEEGNPRNFGEGSNSKYSSGSDRYDSNSSLGSDSSISAKIQNAFGGLHSAGPNAVTRSSSHVDALWFIESFLLPPSSGANESWEVPGVLLMKSNKIHSSNSIRATELAPDTSVPGAAFLWGKRFGLSLDEEGRLSATLKDVDDRASDDVTFLRVPAPLRRVVSVACGYRHTALVTHDRQLYTFGYGECGRLGHGSQETLPEPTLVSYFASLISSVGADVGGVVSVSCGREHTMVVVANGDLYGFGWGEAGRLGTGDSECSLFPVRVSALKAPAYQVACGREHTLVVTRNGEMYAFGAGFGGRLGIGSEADAELPVRIDALEGHFIVQSDAGECHSCALSDTGEVFTWGFGASGALGHGSKENYITPQRVDGLWSVEARGSEPSASAISSIACGSYHTLACTYGGVLYGWGDAAAGQLGDTLLSADDMVVLKPHKLRLPVGSFSSGVNPNGVAVVRQIACGTFTSALTTHDGKLYTWGSVAAGNGAELDVQDAQIRRVDSLSEFSIAQVACGAHHTVALTRKLEYY